MSHNPFSPHYKSRIEKITKPSKDGYWPKKKPLNQPPINSQAKLQSDAPGKSAKLSRGKAI